MIEGTVKYEGSGDVYVAAYIDGVQISGDFPDKLAYKFDYAECNNNAEINFDQGIWKASVNNVGTAKTKCSVYFTTRDQANLISNKIKYFAESDTTNLAYDNTTQNNLRYIGANPNNYVMFNGELWRIIGVFNNIDDGTGKKEWRTKIMRDQNIGYYSWDTSASDVNSGWGINDWNTADLMNLLNFGPYWNRTKGSCYNDKNNIVVDCDFSSSGLSDEAKTMVNDSSWSVGKSASQQTTITIYNDEHTGIKWVGKVGLMHLSDYGYAVGGDARNVCLETQLLSWRDNSDCGNNNWFSSFQFTITALTSSKNHVYAINGPGGVSGEYTYDGRINVKPTLYLASNVSLVGGSGTSIDPYQLSV